MSNEGRIKVSFWWCVLASWIVLPLTLNYGEDNIWYASLVPSSLVGYKCEWRREPRESGLCKRMAMLKLMGLIYLGTLWSCQCITSLVKSVINTARISMRLLYYCFELKLGDPAQYVYVLMGFVE